MIQLHNPVGVSLPYRSKYKTSAPAFSITALHWHRSGSSFTDSCIFTRYLPAVQLQLGALALFFFHTVGVNHRKIQKKPRQGSDDELFCG